MDIAGGELIGADSLNSGVVVFFEIIGWSLVPQLEILSEVVIVDKLIVFKTLLLWLFNFDRYVTQLRSGRNYWLQNIPIFLLFILSLLILYKERRNISHIDSIFLLINKDITLHIMAANPMELHVHSKESAKIADQCLPWQEVIQLIGLLGKD